jgi:hypothetical protein
VADPNDCVCSSTSDAGPCRAPVVDGAIPFVICQQSGIGAGGGAFEYDDGVSTACVDSTAFCGAGTTTIGQAVDGGAYLYGSAIGVAVNGNGSAVMPSGSALGYALSAIPPYGIQINLNAPNGGFYCFRIPADAGTSGTVPWRSFNSQCYTDPLPADAGVFSASNPVIGISFQVNSGPEPASWSFCVTSLSY